MVLVKTCCCGCTLRHGTFGIGIWSAIESTLLTIGGSLLLTAMNDPESVFANKLSDSERKSFKVIAVLYVVEGPFIIVATLFLFLAIKLKKRKLLFPWLIVRGVLLPFTAITMIVLWILGIGGSLAGLNIVVGCILLGYLYVVVLSYYQSDMGRTLTRGGIILATPPQAGISPNSQLPLYAGSPGGPLPPLSTNAYPILQPVSNVLPLKPATPEPTKAGDQPPPYSSNT